MQEPEILYTPMTDWFAHYQAQGLSPSTLAHNLLFQMNEPGFDPIRIAAAAAAGCDLNVKVDFDGRTLLMKAIVNGQHDVVTALLNAGAARECVDSRQETALYYAARSENCDVIRQLVQAGADANHLNMWGHTPLSAAIHSRKLAVVKAMVDDNHKLTLLTLETADQSLDLSIRLYMDEAITLKKQYLHNITHGFPLQNPVAARQARAQIRRKPPGSKP